MQHIDRNWCYVEELQETLKENLTIREAQEMLAKAEKTKKSKTDWYMSMDNLGSKSGSKPDYWSWG